MSARVAPTDAEAALRAHIARQGGDMQAWLQFAALRLQAGDAAEAVAAFGRATALGAPLRLRAHDHALALSNAGDHAAAERLLAQAAEETPPDYPRLLLQGVVVKRAGRLREAVVLFEAARALAPGNPAAWHNLGNTWQQLGQPREAAAAYAEAARLQPGSGGAERLLAQALRDAGELEGAAAAFTRAVALRRTDLELAQEALIFFAGTGRLPAAEALVAGFRAAAGPGAPAILLEARLLLRTGRRDAAIALLEGATTAPEPDRRLFVLLAGAHGDADREAANRVLRAGLALHPGADDLAIALCESLNRTRGPAEAENIQAAYAIARELTDRNIPGLLNHAFTLRNLFRRCVDFDRTAKVGPIEKVAPGWVATNRVAGLHNELGNVVTLEDRLRLVGWHRDWGRRVQARIAELPGPRAAPWVKGSRRIRVGFMSSDLRHHPVSYFALHLLELFDRERFEVFCYSFFEKQKDGVQAHIEGKVTGFRWWPHKPDAEVAAGIRRDGLDILFELGGSTAMNKLEVMAYRPARIGASWLGYPHSSGIERIDYILTDPFIEPEDPRLLIEKPFRMPESWVALGRIGFTDVPIAEALPEEREGRLTFGTMNNPMKYGAACFDAWAAVMRAVPGARFLFVRPEGGTPAFRENVEAGFAARGVDPERIAYIPIRGDHLKHYNAIDIALDPFPHVGGTTTCETLWMGVPVITKVGPAFQERLSYSNLSNAGLPELCARTTEEYIDKAVALAQDRPLRRAMRAGLRGMVRMKPLGQAERFTRHFYAEVAKGGGGMKAVILAGGRGTRLGAETELRPKPMVEIGGRPILWHIMKCYAAHGIEDFVICLGYKGDQIKEYFLNYRAHASDLTVDLGSGAVTWLTPPTEGWRVTLVDTGAETQTGGRLKRVAPHLEGEEAFCLTYGDGVSDIDITASIAFHQAHGRDATVTAVVPPGRFGALDRAGDAVRAFTEKPPGDGATINGGFFVLSPRVFARIGGDDTVFEQAPLRGLAQDGQLRAFDHRGFWHPMDTPRDRDLLEHLWRSGAAPWKQW